MSVEPVPERARAFLAAVPPLPDEPAAPQAPQPPEAPFAPGPSPAASRPVASSAPPAPSGPPVESEPAADAPVDSAALRRWSVGARLASLAGLAVVVVVVAAVVALVAVRGVTSDAARVGRLAEARRLNSETAAQVAAVHAAVVRSSLAPVPGAPAPSEAHIDRLVKRARALAPEVTQRLLPDGLAAERAALTADAGELEAADSVVAGGGDGATTAQTLRREAASASAAATARRRVDERIAALQASAQQRLDGARTGGTRSLLVVVLVGGALLVLASLLVARSISTPLRSLGRAVRRFGDGDLRSRGAEAPDEIGTLARSFNSTARQTATRMRELSADAERGSQLRIIAEALDLALDESDVHRIVEHALGIIAPGRPVELLVNEPGSSTLHRVASNPNGGAPSCPVDDTAGCAAIRRARTLTFESPDTINSCPMLRGRPSGPCSAVCVPINAGGTLVGVVHATGPVGDPPPPSTADQLMTLSSQAGARIGSMRTLESSRVEAATDGLTGVANRRMLSATLGDLLRTATPFVLVVADLDRFKDLNDTYGHEVGDRALQLFAEVLSSNVRGRDLVARFGGEEFVLVYPEMNVRLGMEVLERIRAALAAAVRSANIPPFTASFGVTHSSAGSDVDAILRIADAGLLMAKDLGRDRIVYADADLAAEIFAERREGN